MTAVRRAYAKTKRNSAMSNWTVIKQYATIEQ